MSVRHRDHRHASYMIIGNHIAPKYEDVNRVYRPRDIINDIRREFGITISYTKVYMAKNLACGLIRGKPRESYVKLPVYCHVLEMQNPGTLTFIHTNDDRRFKYLFMALGPSIHGFVNSMRKVISVDGAFLTSRMKGTLLVATSQDANFQIFPLAWGVVDLENDESWTWFFQKLRLITGDTDDLVIIYDHAKCIKNGVRNVFRFAHHGNCIYHLQKNLKTNFPRCDVATLFRAASEAYTVTDFESYMAALCSKKEGIKEYLLEEDFQCWARAHFTGIRYNIMTTNNAESINGLLKSARELPIVGLLEYIRRILQRWFYERHVEAEKCVTQLTPALEKKMCMTYNESNRLEVNQVSPDIYQVGDNLEHHFVDFYEMTCTCRRFDLDKFSCAHTIAAARFKGDEGYKLCTLFYTSICWKQAYSKFVYPLPNEVEWKIPKNVIAREVFSPLVRRQGGQPSKKRKRSDGETRVARKCSRYKKTGHVRSTCTGQAASSEH
ncbi:uncharacterized protein LOC111398216 [Olea europaea var. sylvestris]|uniref:uncharacterized protein LOC111398216 n=1 Tax=Olea europaea var. sylvestris TaxID=158386 RepID=UPI000C1D73C7|nr:uncharacterized protein LOC111398216 [Olea europaea var. sylvestris]